MKGKFTHRVLAAAMVLCMVLALLPAGVLATTVTTTPGNSSLEVEYFSSTLYNWNEILANAATAEADASTGYTSTTVAYSTVASSNTQSYTSTSYYYLVDGTYYPVYYTREGGKNGTYILYYLNGSTYTQIGSTTNGSDTVTLYTSGGYEGKGFYFTGTGNKASTVPSFSQWISNAGYNQNYMIYSGLASKVLSESTNAPFDNDTVNAANLFATDGTNTGYTDVYTNVQVPFYIDDEGYYNLNSDTNAVYFDGGTPTASDGATMTIAALPATYSWENYNVTGFAPFNDVSTTTVSNAVKAGYTLSSGNANTSAYSINGSMQYGFGMVTTVEFQMTDDGKDANGNNITFTFSGDDDVWVYIDGYLVLDIGGTHDAITGTINFVDGTVTLTAAGYNYIGDKATGYVSEYGTNTMSQDNIYDVLSTTLTGFASQGTHTMTIYYMDRGQGRTNCQIRFNLPQKDSVSVTKTIDDVYTDTTTSISSSVMEKLNNIDFTFTLYNSDGIVANKSYSLYDADGNFVSTGSTDAAGTFTLKNGYTATFHNISLDEESSYYVVETSPGNRWSASWTSSSSVGTYTTKTVDGWTSDTVTVTGSNTTTDTIHFYCTNSYAVGEDDPDVDVNDDTIVLDYGLPVEVDVMANDSVTVDGVIYTEDVTLTLTDAIDGTYTGEYGYAQVVDGKIVYTLTRDFCGIETIKYTVTASMTQADTNAEKSNFATATLTIIPATLMYYEENFSNMVTYSTGKVTWKSVGTSLTGYQETGFVGTTTDSTYGTDAVYLTNTGDSYGTSMYADVSGGVYAAAFEYDFTGTGTAILSRISTDSAYICVQITHKDESGATVYDDWQYIDTRVVQNVSNQTTLYNIPVYNNDSLNYGTYHVYVYIFPKNTTVDPTYAEDGTTVLADEKSGGKFYLDGIRVYNPMGGTTYDEGHLLECAVDYDIAASAYATDGESNVSIINIRTKVVSDNLDDLATLTDIDGNIASVDTYSSIGPNEELYLTEDKTVSFQLVNWDSQSYKIYLGIKAPGSASGTVTIGSTTLTTLTIKNGTVCYYDISDYVEVETLSDGTYVGYVTITGGSGLIALTNLKITGVDAFDLAYAEDIITGNEGNAISVASLDTDTLYLLSSAITLTAEAEEEEPVVFTPSSIRTSCVYSKLLRRATISVSTSSDVSYITINGVKVSGYKMMGNLWFSVSYAKVTAGTTYEIVCYDADGNASETYTVTAK